MKTFPGLLVLDSIRNRRMLGSKVKGEVECIDVMFLDNFKMRNTRSLAEFIQKMSSISTKELIISFFHANLLDGDSGVKFMEDSLCHNHSVTTLTMDWLGNDDSLMMGTRIILQRFPNVTCIILKRGGNQTEKSEAKWKVLDKELPPERTKVMIVFMDYQYCLPFQTQFNVLQLHFLECLQSPSAPSLETKTIINETNEEEYDPEHPRMFRFSSRVQETSRYFQKQKEQGSPVNRIIEEEMKRLQQFLHMENVKRYGTGKHITIGVIDSGLDPVHDMFRKANISCKSYVPGESFLDNDGHGTHVAGIIRQFAPDARLNIYKVVGLNIFKPFR